MALRAIGVEPVAQVPSGWTSTRRRAGEDPVGPGGRRIDGDHRHWIDLAHVRDHRNLWQGDHDPIEVEVDSSSANLDAGSPRGRPWSPETSCRYVRLTRWLPSTTPAHRSLSRRSFGASRYMLTAEFGGRAGHSWLPRLLGGANLDVWISCALGLAHPIRQLVQAADRLEVGEVVGDGRSVGHGGEVDQHHRSVHVVAAQAQLAISGSSVLSIQAPLI